MTMKHQSSPSRVFGLANAIVGSFQDQSPLGDKKSSETEDKKLASQEVSEDGSNIETEQDTEHVRYSKHLRELAYLEDSIDQEELKEGERLANISSRKTEDNKRTEDDDDYDEGPWLLSST